ncbi:MAG TPA: hypothetical protein VHE81_22650, partial [Lacipirellulaceae bacterium]|nr:hypothetical protein [Lacipirellulaceae bacterium]
MSNDTTAETDEPRRWSPWAIAAAALLLMMFGVIAVGTIRGCFVNDSEQGADSGDAKKDKNKKEEEKHEFVLESPIVLPSEPKSPLPPAKPGHWATASQEMTSNFRDFVGDSRLSVVDTQGRPYAFASTPFFLRASRPVLLSKARPKATQTTFFVPQVAKTINIQPDLEERGLGSAHPQARTPLTTMPSYQYDFVVLAKTPTRFSYIKTLDCVQSPFDGESDQDSTEDAVHYRVVELGADQASLLPDNPLTWTSISYVLWDEIDPGDPFPAEQKKALVDWLHWGGQLILNGPDSLDLLKGSFLDAYLPATSGGARKLAPDDPDIAALSNGWMISNPPAAPGTPLRPKAPWSGITLKLRPGAEFLPNTGRLFAERQVGRGRIVVSAIRLSERDFINWRSGFESFFNACLLRRPPRKYIPGAFGGVTLNWAANNLKEHRLDAALNTHLRYFARDLGIASSYHYEDTPDPTKSPPAAGIAGAGPGGITRPWAAAQPTVREYIPPDNPGGVGAWNDFSDTANAARMALRKAAGVEVPNAGFVVFCLAIYLIALVPLNWLIFNTLGRVEWAWIAAPVIAVIGTWVIVQRARLDIGFVRAQTEIGVLEQQPDHARALLSRYTALYTSLSTTYDFDFPNMTTLIAPFPSDANFQLLTGQGLTAVNFQRYDDVRLTGLPISSNSTGMVHSEQMLSLGGPIRIGTSLATNAKQVENHSKLELRSACLVKREGADLKGRWIGDLLPGQSAPLEMFRISTDKPFADDRNKEATIHHDERLDLEPMFRLALDPHNI